MSKTADFCQFDSPCVDWVYATALRQTANNAALAADVAQAVFIVMHRKGASIPPASLPAWLHKVTIYAARNAVRAEARRWRHEHAAASQRPEATMANDQLESIAPSLDRAIAALPAKDRTIIIERFLRGEEIEAIAARVGLSVAATRKRIERAIVKLRGYFRRHGFVLGAAGVPWPSKTIAPSAVRHAIQSRAAATSPLARAVAGHFVMMKLATTVGIAVLAAGGAFTGAAWLSAVMTSRPAVASQPRPSTTTAPGVKGVTGEVTIGGDVPRPGVYSLSPGPQTDQALIASAGFDLRPGDGFMVTPRAPASSQPVVPADNSIPHDGDRIDVVKAPPAVPAGSRLAPFSDIRWNGDNAEVRFRGTWYRWIAINDVPVSAMVEGEKAAGDDQWQKRIGEDLVGVYDRTGDVAGRPGIGSDARLYLQPLDGGPIQMIGHAPMTAANRREVYLNRQRRDPAG